MARNDWFNKVKHIMSIDADTRDDDFALYYVICRAYTDAPIWAMSFEEAMLNHDKHGLPSYEAVTRARRRVQAQCPELRGKKYERRMERQADFLDEFARDYR
jgi:hypothetical protein